MQSWDQNPGARASSEGLYLGPDQAHRTYLAVLLLFLPTVRFSPVPGNSLCLFSELRIGTSLADRMRPNELLAELVNGR